MTSSPQTCQEQLAHDFLLYWGARDACAALSDFKQGRSKVSLLHINHAFAFTQAVMV